MLSDAGRQGEHATSRDVGGRRSGAAPVRPGRDVGGGPNVGSQLTLQWFLTAAGIPSERAQALVFGALKRFGWWAPLTAVEIGEIAERVARDALSPTGIVPTGRIDNWPDTWPHGWPSWRATNTGWGAGSPSDRGHSA
ncbi:hypothetical protein [Micromonospora sp. CPCC 205558]|uniref:hypothetical protein n=1 Tax=Micromonospora sp. CPCC 205558 TaxID=3122403 RepID=UPI002FEF2BD4